MNSERLSVLREGSTGREDSCMLLYSSASPSSWPLGGDITVQHAGARIRKHQRGYITSYCPLNDLAVPCHTWAL
jgi:hypothetical protein